MRRTCSFRRDLYQSRWAEQVLLCTFPDSDTAPPPAGKVPPQGPLISLPRWMQTKNARLPHGNPHSKFPRTTIFLGTNSQYGSSELICKNCVHTIPHLQDERRTQVKADESPSGCELTWGSSGRKNEVASQGFCNYPQVFFFLLLLSVYFEVISNFKKICKSSLKNSHIT